MDSVAPNPAKNGKDTDIVVNADGDLSFAGQTYRAAIGKTGMRADKTEGDGASPTGIWNLRYVMYRADRLPPVKTALPVYQLVRNDGWCDDPHSDAYNRPVRLPFAKSHEKLWREDHIYDVIVALDHNDSPAIAGRGSAIFMHIARPAYDGTEGCIALAKNDLIAILANCTVSTRLCIGQK
ncbi:L,D-transpeptidase family protein [Thalassospira mesophila]|uniref:L,D-transpeptidase family protein n=1 Tax=Thalassospira mesophila TaxID=1293891 RepID=UPI000A1F3C5C|nr:L,D-transpeptidase family protein [Thalassospira mesophila]